MLHMPAAHMLLVIGGSLLMIVGALGISTAVASAKENSSTNEAVLRECDRYGLDYNKTLLAQSGDEFDAKEDKRRWWDYAIVITATTGFITLGVRAVVPSLAMELRWVAILGVVLALSLGVGGWSLWRRTRFF